MIAALRCMELYHRAVSPRTASAPQRSPCSMNAGSTLTSIEVALAHQDEDGSPAPAYNRYTYWKERVHMLQAWADFTGRIPGRSARTGASPRLPVSRYTRIPRPSRLLR